MINQIEVGKYIKQLRIEHKLSQKELSQKLFVSFQAVSKWENGVTLPDVNSLVNLSYLLDTNVDKILSGGKILLRRSKYINIDNIKEGFKTLENLKYYFGEKSTFYLGAIEGINNKMNIDFEEYMQNESYRETFLGEVIIQYLMNGYVIDKQDIEKNIKREKLKTIIYRYIDNNYEHEQ
jgi:transcriptional regulator with XRE-family HTH domain